MRAHIFRDIREKQRDKREKKWVKKNSSIYRYIEYMINIKDLLYALI